ncbi:ABC transporter ATP-binding protein [uncultured Tessaracoccus sp.]|uniref:ABC transporter ATP-binding protein n=1 Tax=uncultured Tessaracoccus sp. TaxID=905023 RepID=UPI0025F01783|nr:ABC transporter ATP-binding protein [uncultured Tessaracoccus sp.]
MSEQLAAHPAIDLQGLVKRYGRVEALRGIDLTVLPGEVFGFLGPNGAGKSTTIRILLDELRATAGTATVLGLDPRRDAVALHRRIGYLPSDLALHPKMRGRDVLQLFARLRGGVDQALVRGLAERLDVDLDKRAGELSTGNRQKLGLIAAFMHRPELVILDEPASGLDPLVQHEFHAIVRETVDDGRTVFLSSHSLPEVQRVADRVAIIRAGAIVAVERVDDLRAVRRVTLLLDSATGEHEFDALPGVTDVQVQGPRVTLNHRGELGQLLDVVGARHRIRDLTAADADLEDVFLTYYADPR